MLRRYLTFSTRLFSTIATRSSFPTVLYRRRDHEGWTSTPTRHPCHFACVAARARHSAICFGPRTRPTPSAMAAKYQLVLIRHGESQWNVDNRFTGWHDVPLSATGEKESHEAGRVLKEAGFEFDLAYTSVLKRAIKTLWNILEEMDRMWIPVIRNWKLNERHYGALTGLNKQETVDKHGIDQVMVWRRSYAIPPPALDSASSYYPGNDVKYADVPKEELPFTESLATTGERVVPYWENVIVPSIKAGKKILIAAHGNSLRALVKHLDNISEDTITGLNIPTGVPLVYDLDENFKPVPHKDAIAPLTGRYVGNQEEIKARIAGVANQTKAH